MRWWRRWGRIAVRSSHNGGGFRVRCEMTRLVQEFLGASIELYYELR